MVASRAVRAARGMTMRYGFALCCIGLLVTFTNELHTTLNRANESTALIVNISGRQRMLTQRSAAFTLRIAHEEEGPERIRHARTLALIAEELLASHRVLLYGDPARNLPPIAGDALTALYLSGPNAIDGQLSAYLPLLRQVADDVERGRAPGDPLVTQIFETATGPLLDALDNAVFRHQLEGEARTRGIGRLQALSFALALAVLVVEAVVIFRPMVRRVRAELEANAKLIEELEATRDGLAREVARQTGEIREARDAALAAAQAKSRFLAHASHDLLQPLDAIGMFANALERDDSGQRRHAVLADLRGALRSMKKLLSAIIEISQLESGVVQPRPRNFALAPLLQDVAAQLRGRMAQKGLELRLAPTALTLHTDPELLERILRNILANAVRYTKQGGILIACRHRMGELAICIYDTGPGIDTRDLDRIFEEFTQLDDPARDRSEGIGLGLAIVDRLAKLLNARVDVRSRPGRGSVFSLVLPPGSVIGE